jgi:IS5 family transposase
LSKKVIEKCNRIASGEKIVQRQRDTRESKQLLRETYNNQHSKRAKAAKRAVKRLRTIAGRQVRGLGRKISEEQKSRYTGELDKYK